MFIDSVNSSQNYVEICEKIGVYPNTRNRRRVKERMEFLNLAPSFFERLKQYKSRINKPKVKADPKRQKEEKFCVKCGSVISSGSKSGLCRECYLQTRKKEKIDKWLKTGDSGYTSADSTIRGAIREYIFNDQNGKCAICGIPSFWNGKELHFILDHINRDASQSNRENLRLICPNCDSQLDTYKSKNKNSKRYGRKKFLHEKHDSVQKRS